MGLNKCINKINTFLQAYSEDLINVCIGKQDVICCFHYGFHVDRIAELRRKLSPGQGPGSCALASVPTDEITSELFLKEWQTLSLTPGDST